MKKIINRAIRSMSHRGMLNWMPDAMYLKLMFRVRFGQKLNLSSPETYNEKLQWLKLHDRNPEYTKMVDKYEAKKYVASIIGEEYIIPTLGVWDRFEDIDFSKLPDQFVLKCTHDSGGLVICRDKDSLDYAAAKKKINASLKKNYYYSGREWPYKNVKPRIIAEKYMEDGHKGLRDYKFFNFNGRSRFIYVSEGLEDHATARISFFDFEGNRLPFERMDYEGFDDAIEFPANFKEMKGVSDKLASSIKASFVRTDFYSINGLVYFSEITFCPCNGMIPFSRSEWDGKIGSWLKLPEKKSLTTEMSSMSKGKADG